MEHGGQEEEMESVYGDDAAGGQEVDLAGRPRHGVTQEQEGADEARDDEPVLERGHRQDGDAQTDDQCAGGQHAGCLRRPLPGDRDGVGRHQSAPSPRALA